MSTRKRGEKRLTSRVTDAIDQGANAAEEIHKSIANFPLRVIKQLEILEETVDGVQRIQDRSIGAVYDLVRNINHEVGKLTEELLAGPRKRAARRPKPAAKPGVRKAAGAARDTKAA